jgi:hypothetical protein
MDADHDQQHNGYDRGAGFGLGQVLSSPSSPLTTRFVPSNKLPFKIKTSDGVIVGRYGTRPEANAALREVMKATGCVCTIDS